VALSWFILNQIGKDMSALDSISSYRDLKVWQRGMDLVETVYQLSSSFPDSERYGLTSQVRRAAVSIPSNVAEGWGRSSTKQFVHQLDIARASLYEVETQLLIGERLGFLDEERVSAALSDSEVLSRMLLALLRSLQK
jgi:four helix bundle protein